MRTRHPHPSVFMILIIPFGVMVGYLTVAVAYLLTKGGLSVAQVASLVALGILPHTWKFAGAPIADPALGRKKWSVLACIFTAIGIFGIGILPPVAASIPLLTAI